ncbi:hypothetical protein SDRG_02768 [Saprolegnia diclina VS20]|uniref:Guanylate cyclase domain-containing protein n=1 Tax=Saprolegnia diclina (strain VS20) TaxID=1156394 RepID=T0R1C4_SAPDV|nr:hypothetical protein SDRG_02768 [Saprolegnia diclina VS20]EQC40115.1 hypothetical protein SDRG_02768 [Saprolegnia diclina VS20]|eukprot:XP_008606589.1 hypothetical protein SDRG_02768 [Saprolegnia diclina VS20]
MLPIWSLIYVLVLFVSFIATSMAVYTMFRLKRRIRTCVFYATYAYFISRTVYSLTRAVVLAAVVDQFFQANSTWMEIDSLRDVSAFSPLTDSSNDPTLDAPPNVVMWFLLIGDAALIAGALWMLVLVLELVRLARKAMDRGSIREARTIKYYGAAIMVLVLSYFALSFVLSTGRTEGTMPNTMTVSFYSGRFKSVLITAISIQSGVILLVATAMWFLRRRGRNFESVDGELTTSPLYMRLKRILSVYCIMSLPYIAMTWLSLICSLLDTECPSVLLGIATILYFASGLAFAIVMVGSQQCCYACLLPADEVRTAQLHLSPSPKHAQSPVAYPVFVNTDIESSSLLWGQLGQTMHDAQELHDNLLRSLIVKHHGYEITTCGDAFQLAFQSIADAVAYCLDVQLELMNQPWPVEFVDSGLPGSLTVSIRTKHVPLTKPKHMYLFHGIRVRMGIHAASEAEGQLFHQVHPVTHRTTYVGLSELIGREVSDLGNGGQIVVTTPIAKWLESQALADTEWSNANPFVVQDLGVYRVADLKIDLGLAEVLPLALKDRRAHFQSIANVQSRKSYTRHDSTAYGLVGSPRDTLARLV